VELVDQVVLQQRLYQVAAAVDLQFGSILLFECGDGFGNVTFEQNRRGVGCEKSDHAPELVIE
jgi:hypothetical protein